MANNFKGTWSVTSMRALKGTNFVQGNSPSVGDYTGASFTFKMSIKHNGDFLDIDLSSTEVSGSATDFTISHTYGTTPNQRTYTGTVKKCSVTQGAYTETFLIGILGRTSLSIAGEDGCLVDDSDTISFTAVKTG